MGLAESKLNKPTPTVVNLAVSTALLAFLGSEESIDDMVLANEAVRLNGKGISMSSLNKALLDSGKAEDFWASFDAQYEKIVKAQALGKRIPKNQSEKIEIDAAVDEANNLVYFTYKLSGDKVFRVNLGRIAESTAEYSLESLPASEKIMFDAVLPTVRQELAENFEVYFKARDTEADKLDLDKAKGDEADALRMSILRERQAVQTVSGTIKEALHGSKTEAKASEAGQMTSILLFEPGTMKITKVFRDRLEKRKLDSLVAESGAEDNLMQHISASKRYSQEIMQRRSKSVPELFENAKQRLKTIKESEIFSKGAKEAIAESEQFLNQAKNRFPTQDKLNKEEFLPTDETGQTLLNEIQKTHEIRERRDKWGEAEKPIFNAISRIDIAQSEEAQYRKEKEKRARLANIAITIFVGGVTALAVIAVSSILALQIVLPIVAALGVWRYIRQGILADISVSSKRALLIIGMVALTLSVGAALTLAFGGAKFMGIVGIGVILTLGPIGFALIAFSAFLGLIYAGYKTYQAWQELSSAEVLSKNGELVEEKGDKREAVEAGHGVNYQGVASGLSSAEGLLDSKDVASPKNDLGEESADHGRYSGTFLPGNAPKTGPKSEAKESLSSDQHKKDVDPTL